MADQRQRQKREEEEQARIEKQRNLLQDYKNKMMPLVQFLKKEGLEFRYARVGKGSIEFFRIDEYNKLKELKKDKIDANEKIKELFNEVKNDFIHFRRPADMKNLKYPAQLEPVAANDPNAKFYSFRFDTTISKKGNLIALIAIVMLLVLFPVWPYAFKYAIWLVSLYLLIFLVGLLVFRLAIYVVCVILGFNVWIFPNMLGDYGFLQSFKPFIYYEKWESSTLNIAIRICSCSFIMYCGICIYEDPSILQQTITTTKSTIDDIHDWGDSKIKNQIKFSERALPNLEDILNETSDYKSDEQSAYDPQAESDRREQAEQVEQAEQAEQVEQALQWPDSKKEQDAL